MKKIILFLTISLFSINASASFIAGGNITMSHVSSYNYFIELDLYFDNYSADQAGAYYVLSEDSTIEVAIYEKVTNKLMDTVILKKISKNFIPYSDSSCTINQLSTRLEKYIINNNTATIELNPSTYNSPNGYYIVWERCCRASFINIANALETGMAFYMEFPAVTTASNASFIDSSPIPATYKNGYAISGASYSLNLACTDADGDSLVYSMATPLAGYSSLDGMGPGAEPIPPNPANAYQASYPLIQWASGYSASNAVPGKPPLSVDPHTGILSVTTDSSGYYAFAVLCEEYRDAVKIGEIREELFLLVMNQDSIVCQSATGITAATSLNVILYPNPASGIVNFSSNTSSEFTYEVLTTVGATVLSGLGKSFITSAIKPGIYFVKISSGQQSSIQKLIIE